MRGKQSKALSFQRKNDLSFAKMQDKSDDTLEKRIIARSGQLIISLKEGTVADQGQFSSLRVASNAKQNEQKEIKIWLSDHYDKNKYLNQLSSYIEKTPWHLLRNFNKIFLVGKHAPQMRGAACADYSAILFFRVKENNDQLGLNEDIFYHELAHTFYYGGPENERKWQKAQEKDKSNSAKFNNLPETICLKGKPFFKRNSLWMSARRGKDSIEEDFAVSFATFMMLENNFKDKRVPLEEDKYFSFEELYPNRTKILKKLIEGR